MEKRNYKKLTITRTTAGSDFIFGIHPVQEALNAGREIDKLLVQSGGQGEPLKALLGLAREKGVPVSVVPQEKLNRVTRKNHQGVVAFLSSVSFASIDYVVDALYAEGKPPCLLILDRITDVRNFGAIVRTAECAGVNAIIVPAKGNAALGSDAMKTSAGALNYVPICRENNLKETIRYLKNSGLQVIACTEKADQTIYQTDFAGPVAIIMGSEGEGISPEYLKLADATAAIPLAGTIDSLNVSVACGVTLYEILRQRLPAEKR